MNHVILTLQRGKESKSKGFLGSLYMDKRFLCFTLEEPWRNNAPADPNGETESCIPEGTYNVVRHGWEPNSTVRFKNVWRLLNVPGREAILIHAGNTLADTEGCILVGMSAVPGGIGASQSALAMLRKTLPETFQIEVKNP